MHDALLTATERLVGYEIGCYLNSKSGDAWPAQSTMAARLGIDLKSVKRGVSALSGNPKKKGGPRRVRYLHVVWDSTRRSNSYVPCFTPERPLGGILPPTDGDNFTPLHGSKLSGGRDNTPRSDGDKNGPLTSLREQFNDQIDISQADTLSPNEARWLSVKNRLRISLTPALVTSWFQQIDVATITESEVVMVARTRFVRSYIKNNLLFDRLTDAWRAELPAIERVLLVDPVDAE